MEKDPSTQPNPPGFNGCLYFGLIGDPTTKALFPTKNGSCHATKKPTLLDIAYQDQFCLRGQHKNCPVFVHRTESQSPPNLTYRKGFWVPTKASAQLASPRIRILAGILMLVLLLGAGFWFLNQGGNLPALAQGTPAETTSGIATQTPTPTTESSALTLKATAISSSTPTVTPTHTPTTELSATPRITVTVTASKTASVTPAPTNTTTATATQTPTATPTTTPTSTATATAVPATQPPPTPTRISPVAPTSIPSPTMTAIPQEPTPVGPPPATATKISLSP